MFQINKFFVYNIFSVWQKKKIMCTKFLKKLINNDTVKFCEVEILRNHEWLFEFCDLCIGAWEILEKSLWFLDFTVVFTKGSF